MVLYAGKATFIQWGTHMLSLYMGMCMGLFDVGLKKQKWVSFHENWKKKSAGHYLWNWKKQNKTKQTVKSAVFWDWVDP